MIARARLLRASLTALTLALLVLLALLCVNCSPSSQSTWQEPVTSWARTVDGNPVAYGASVPEELHGQIAAMIARVVRGRLAGVRFYVVHFPVTLLGTPGVHSFRTSGRDALVVLSWWQDEQGLHVEDIPWEVEHLVSGTTDQGRRL